MLPFGRCGREILRDFKISDIWLSIDSDQHRYIYMKRDELTKNHQTDPNTADGEMFEMKCMLSKKLPE